MRVYAGWEGGMQRQRLPPAGLPSQSPSVTALPEGEPLACRSGSCWTLKARQGAKGRALLQRAGPSSYNLSVSLRSTMPGCGSQRLLRCRLHPAGRCPNSSSLFRPLAAVVAVAPSRGASGETVHFAGTAKASPRRGGGIAQAMTERLYEGKPFLCRKVRLVASFPVSFWRSL